jgi:BRCT domain type II-containing protein
VEKSTLQKQTEQNTVLQDVNKKQQTCKDHKSVKCVGKPFLQQHIEQKLAQENVKNVYNLKVENAGCYYANGILVSNCDSEAMFGSEIIEEGSKPQRITVIKRPF